MKGSLIMLQCSGGCDTNTLSLLSPVSCKFSGCNGRDRVGCGIVCYANMSCRWTAAFQRNMLRGQWD